MDEKSKNGIMTEVLRILNRFNLGGPTFNAAYLTKYMEPEFHTVLAGGTIDDTEGSSRFILDDLGIKPVVIPEMKRKVKITDDIKAYYTIKKLIKETNPTIVHTHASKAGALGRLAAAKMKVPVIVHTFHGHVFHSYFGKFKSNLVIQTERYLAKKTTAIIAISEKQKSELADEFKICPPEKIHVIPLGFDLTRFRTDKEEKRKKFRKKYNLDDSITVFSIVGRLVPVKNHRLFIDMMIEIEKQFPGKTKGMIVGDGELKNELENYVSTKCKNASIDREKLFCFTSWISEIDEVNAGSDIIVLTSLNEGTPVSLIEAQASGKPVLSTRVGGIENVVAEGKTALLSPSENLEQLVQNASTLLNNKQMLNNFGANGWEIVGKKFHFERLVADMKNLYEKLLVSTT
jgi:glycosyltransferase involved in cell wall biosynthesis